MTLNKTNWKAVSIFFLLACLWSWPFFWLRDMHSESWKALEIPKFLKTWSYMWGPGIAAVACFFTFRSSHKREMTFAGTSLWRGLFFFCLLPSVLAILNKDVGFLGIGFMGFVSILGEELGWRGFLQDALKIKSDYTKAAIIGCTWEIWHFTTRFVNQELLSGVIRVCIWMLITFTLSFIIIKLTKHTKSLFVAVAIHMAVNASFEFSMGWQSVLVCLPIWLFLYRNWIQADRAEQTATG